MSISFKNDYGQLAHPRILEALTRYGQQTNIPYGLDSHSENASRLILDIFDARQGKTFFLAGGTQTNMVFISSVLRPFQGVLSCVSGHINVHETAAVEGAGHKIYVVPGNGGKLYPQDIENAVKANVDEHMVQIKMVYISNSTEIGTIYSRQELLALRQACDKYGLYLFIDGARLGSALTSKANDVEPSLLGKVADAFYVGGTKNGLLYGEALVIVNPGLQTDFRYHIKHKGAMLAKGYGLGIQFEEAFKDGLYFEIAKKTNDMAALLREGCLGLGLDVGISPTNQIFITFPKEVAIALINEYGCEKWEEKEDKMTIRFVTSFMTTEEEVKEALLYIKNLIGA